MQLTPALLSPRRSSRFQFGELGFSCAAVAVMAALTLLFYSVVRWERR